MIVPVMLLVRWLHGRVVFTERDWLRLSGHPRENIHTAPLWLRFAALLLAVVATGLVFGLYLLPYGLGWFAGVLLVVGAAALHITPEVLR